MQRPQFHACGQTVQCLPTVLTRAIQLLEQEFGGYLFGRKRSNIELTDLGKLVRPYFEEFWRTASTAKQIAKEYSAKAPKELNLAVMCTIAPKLLLQMLSRFRTKHPEVRMQLTDGDAQLLASFCRETPVFVSRHAISPIKPG
jgi:DNA-binding transcriptional LysR family regulator